MLEALVKYIEEHFRAPATGGRYTNHAWDVAKLVSLSEETLCRLERIAAHLSKRVGHEVYPMQVAAILIELGVEEHDDRHQ
jgi:hypothetical protein